MLKKIHVTLGQRGLGLYVACLLFVMCMGVFITGSPVIGNAWAQEKSAATQESKQERRSFTVTAYAESPSRMSAGQHNISLWGLVSPEEPNSSWALIGRTELSELIGSEKIKCEVKKQESYDILAQCLNAQDQDLGLAMIGKGFAIVNRRDVEGTVFKDPYIVAETQARKQGAGLWDQQKANKPEGVTQTNSDLWLTISIISALFTLSFVALSYVMARGFGQVAKTQDKFFQLVHDDRNLQEKERYVVGSMILGELKGNKSKIEAFLVVYEELLRSIMDTQQTPKYRKAGDIVQLQPGLDRAVFDSNTDKIETLGSKLSSEVIHFYARIKTQPEYQNLEPDTPQEKAQEIVEGVVKKAKTLDQIAAKLIIELESKSVG